MPTLSSNKKTPKRAETAKKKSAKAPAAKTKAPEKEKSKKPTLLTAEKAKVVREKTAKAQKAVKEKIKKLPAAAKEAPKKIVEHTLEATLNSVEKAAENKARRASKRAFRATVKARKAVRAMLRAKRAAIKAEAEVEAISGAFPSESGAKRAKKPAVGAKAAALGIRHATGAAAKNAAREIRERIKQALHPTAEEVFFYERRQIVILTLIYAAVAGLVWKLANSALYCSWVTNWFTAGLLIVVMFLALAALASVVLVLLIPQTLAVLSAKGIKIDHNELLEWNDIALAEEKYSGALTHLPFIVLHLKPGAETKYRLTFMQNMCRYNVFTPFSIPLYAMAPEDADKIRELIRRRVKYQDNRAAGK